QSPPQLAPTPCLRFAYPTVFRSSVLSPTVVLTVFVYCSRALLALHSFPTRRSSDLPAVSTPGVLSHSPPRRCSYERGRSYARRRSEEHTSELQSRFDLVCRLLLEKKNDS